MLSSPMGFGTANGSKVECLHDTGSSVSIVNSSLVRPEQYTGDEVTCILVDIIIIIIITKTMFMVLSSWQSHCESSPGSFDECRMAPSGRDPKPSQTT